MLRITNARPGHRSPIRYAVAYSTSQEQRRRMDRLTVHFTSSRYAEKDSNRRSEKWDIVSVIPRVIKSRQISKPAYNLNPLMMLSILAKTAMIPNEKVPGPRSMLRIVTQKHSIHPLPTLPDMIGSCQTRHCHLG